MLENRIHGKGLKPKLAILESLKKDLEWVFNLMQPQK